MTQDPLSLAKRIDHTLLRPEALESQFEKLCDEAIQHSFMSVCVPPTWLKYCANRLKGSDVKTCTVLGFPLGYSEPEPKLCEAKLALENGVDEIDMVLNFSALINGMHDPIHSELKSLREISKGKILKLILETCYLNTEQITEACTLAVNYQWDFVKTSTGFGFGGATEADIRLMKSAVGDKAEVKASGGIRDQQTALKMLNAGASRLGTSDGVAIVSGTQAGKGSY